jgi:hypothetical protein
VLAALRLVTVGIESPLSLKKDGAVGQLPRVDFIASPMSECPRNGTTINLQSAILAASNYRLLGRVTADDLFIEKWLLRKEIVTRTTQPIANSDA